MAVNEKGPPFSGPGLLDNASHGETHYPGTLHYIFRTIPDGGWRNRSIGLGASPHAHGGASYAVKHSRRKYLLHVRLMADSSAKAVYGGGVSRSAP